MLMPAKIDTSGGSVAQPSRPRPQPTPSPSPSPSTSGQYYENRLNGGGASGTVQGSAGTTDEPTSYSDWRNSKTRYDNTLPIGYKPPTTTYLSADRREREVQLLPDIFKVQTIGQALDLYWGNAEARQTIIAAARAHYASYSNFNDQWAENYWKDIVNASNTPGAAAPWEVLQNDLRAAGADESGAGSFSGGGSYGGYGGGGGYSGGGGSTTQQINLANPSEARGLLAQYMQATVGRNPDAREVKKFIELLQGYQTNNPNVQTISGSTVTQSGGVDPGMVAQQFVETLPDYTESQADSYYRAFMSALLGGAA